MIYIEQFQTLTSIPEKLNSGDKLMTLTDEGLSVKNTKTGKEYFIKGDVLHYEESLNHTTYGVPYTMRMRLLLLWLLMKMAKL